MSPAAPVLFLFLAVTGLLSLLAELVAPISVITHYSSVVHHCTQTLRVNIYSGKVSLNDWPQLLENSVGAGLGRVREVR